MYFEQSGIAGQRAPAFGRILTAKVRGLDAGADDYLAKPFELSELQARLRALINLDGVVCCTALATSPFFASSMANWCD